MKFLLVDDAQDPLKQLQRIIEDMGHEVVGYANNGEDAVRQYEALHPDAVMMDVIMPRMNGIEALQAIRALDPCARVVMTCSLRSCQTAFTSERCGALFFLNKPFEEPSLRNVIHKLEASVAGDCGQARTEAAGSPSGAELPLASVTLEAAGPLVAPPVSPPRSPR
ncbi:MAG TPA: response regulator [bacterium]|nr:response regulator [bacterium]